MRRPTDALPDGDAGARDRVDGDRFVKGPDRSAPIVLAVTVELSDKETRGRGDKERK